ncbi:MAG: hypothetical protein AAF799_36845 [Myxococcota bacterium]
MAIGLLLGLGCDPAPASSSAPDVSDTRAVGLAASSLEGIPRLVFFGLHFAVDPALQADDAETFLDLAVDDTRQSLVDEFSRFGCETLQIEADGTALSAVLRECPVLAWTFDAEVEAVAQLEQADASACADDFCPTAVAWELDIAELALGPRQGRRNRFSGPARLRAPVDPAEPMQWQTSPGYTLETRIGPRFDMLSTARWRTDDSGCVDMEVGSRLQIEQTDEPLDGTLGDIVISSRGVRRCPLSCPQAGEVEVSFRSGSLLRWIYTGEDTVQVTGPLGKTLEVTLSCAAMDEEPADE